MLEGRAGGVDRKPLCEQLADMSTSVQMQTSGGQSNEGLTDPDPTPFDSLLDDSFEAEVAL
jgi:hypothetical protein